MTLTIANGHIVLNGKLEKKNIIIENGKITEISNNSVGERINADGKIILPGLIDVHVHLREPGMTHKEDFLTGTMAAAAGGVTTVLDMPNTKPQTTTIALLNEKREIAREKAMVNYGFHLGATTDNITEVRNAKNIAAVKIYMGSSTGNMLLTDRKTISAILESGKKTIIHAENEEIIKKNAEKYKNETDAAVHAKIRSNEAEYTAVRQAAELAQNASMHITHISTRESIQIIKEAKKKQSISCDVTPHHLFLTYEELKKQGNFAKMNPALRSQQDAEALWKGIESGVVDCIATDHAPHTIEEKEADYREAPAGVPGLETMLPLLLDAVNRKRITLQKVVELTATNPARIFGIKNKGKIATGMDADIAIVDMNEIREVKNEELFTKCKWTPFNGWKLKGCVKTTIVGGQIIFNENEAEGKNGTETEFINSC